MKQDETIKQLEEILERWKKGIKQYETKATQNNAALCAEMTSFFESKKEVFAKTDGELDKFVVTAMAPSVIDAILEQDGIASPLNKKDISVVLEQLTAIALSNWSNPDLENLKDKVISSLDSASNWASKSKDKSKYAWRNAILDRIEGFEQTIKKGDEVDVFVKEGDLAFCNQNYFKGKGEPGCNAWLEGTVVTVKQDLIQVEPAHFSTIISFSKFARRVAPRGYFATDTEWRANLKVGDEVDVLQDKVWESGTVVDIVGNNLTKSCLKIGHRLYRDNGLKQDEANKKSFFGWGSVFDKEYSAFHPRIRRYGTMAKKVNDFSAYDKWSLKVKKQNLVETWFPFESPIGSTFIVPQFDLADNKDINFFMHVNKFGSQGGFQLLIEELASTSSVSRFCKILAVYSHLSDFIHSEFAVEHLEKLKNTVTTVFIEFKTKDNLKFKDMTLISALSNLEEATSKIYFSFDNNAMMLNLKVELALALFESEILDKKLTAVRLLAKLIKDVEALSIDEKATGEEVKTKLMSYGVVQAVFDTNSHFSVIQTGLEIFSEMLKIKGFIRREDMERIVTVCVVQPKEIKSKFISKAKNFQNNSEYSEMIIEIMYSLTKASEDEIDCLLTMFKKKSIDYNKRHNKAVGEFLLRLLFGEEGDKFITLFSKNIAKIEFDSVIEDIVDKLISIAEDPKETLRVMRIYNLMCSQDGTTSVNKVKNLRHYTKLKGIIEAQFDKVTEGEQEEEVLEAKLKEMGLEMFFTVGEKVIKDNNEGQKVVKEIFERFGPAKSVCNYQTKLLFEFLERIDELNVIKADFYVEIADSLKEIKKVSSETSNEFFRSMWKIFSIINKNKISFEKAKVVGSVDSSGNKKMVDSFKPTTSSRVEGNPFDLEGFELLWNIVVNLKEGSDDSSMIKLISLFYANIDFVTEYSVQLTNRIVDEMENAVEEPQKYVNLAKMLRTAMQQSERFSAQSVYSHSSLCKREIVSVYVKVNIINNELDLDLNMFGNSTVWELKCIVADKMGVTPYDFNFDNAKLSCTNHAKTLKELNVNKDLALVSSKTNGIKIKKERLIEENMIDLTPKFKEVILELFNRFGKDAKMDKEAVVNFIKTGTDIKNTHVNDLNRLKLLMSDEDIQRGYIELEQLELFFKSSIIEKGKEHVVWNNLNKFGYREDLKGMSEPVAISIDLDSLPRKLVGLDNKMFNRVFAMCNHKEEKVRTASLTLIQELATNKQIIDEISCLDKTDEIVNWEKVLNSAELFELNYKLEIIEYFLENIDFNYDKDIVQERNIVDNDCLTWCKNFFAFGGLNELLKQLFSVKGGLDALSLNLIERLLNVVKSCLSFAFRSKKEEKQDVTVFARKFSVNDKVEETENTLVARLLKEMEKDSITVEIESEFIVKGLVGLSELIISQPQKSGASIVLSILKMLSLVILSTEKDLSKVLLDYKTDSYDFSKFLDYCLKIDDSEVQSKVKTYYLRLVEALLDRKSDSIVSSTMVVLDSKIKTLENEPNKSTILDIYTGILNLTSITKDKLDLALFLMKRIEKAEVVSRVLLSGYMKLIDTIVSKDDTFRQETNWFIKILIDRHFIRTSKVSDSSAFVEPNKIEDKMPIWHNIGLKHAFFSLLSTYMNQDLDQVYETLFNTKLGKLKNHLQLPSARKYALNDIKTLSSTFTGLKNQGSTCYMNSLIQQLFAIPAFRQAILQVNDEKPVNQVPECSDDSFLHQLQKMFTFLQFSNKTYYDTKEFCYSFKEYDGNPTNVIEQKDVQEFLLRFTDNLEAGLKDTPFKYLTSSIYKGKSCVSKKCMGDCGTVKTSFEDFVSLSLEIRDLSTLDESIAKLCSPEMIEDYACETCEKKTTLEKRLYLQDLPNVLLVHLQRITFDYTEFRNIKVTSKLEFPEELNLKKYHTPTSMGEDVVVEMEDDYFSYSLVGVIIHVGSADSGHYFSYINTQREGEKNERETDAEVKEKWFNFNDSSVTKYNLWELQADCFGGVSTSAGIDDAVGPSTPLNGGEAATYGFDTEFSQSAYMLVYERKAKMPFIQAGKGENRQTVELAKDNLKSTLDQYNALKKGNASVEDGSLQFKPEIFETQFFDSESEEWFHFTPFYTPLKAVKANYYKEVIEENAKVANNTMFFSKGFADYIGSAFKMLSSLKCSSDEEQQKIEKIIKFLVKSQLNVVQMSIYNSVMP